MPKAPAPIKTKAGAVSKPARAGSSTPRKHHPPFAKLVVDALEAFEDECASAAQLYKAIEEDWGDQLASTWKESAKKALHDAVEAGTVVKPSTTASSKYYLPTSGKLPAATRAAAKAGKLREPSPGAEGGGGATPKAATQPALAAKGGVKKAAAAGPRKSVAARAPKAAAPKTPAGRAKAAAPAAAKAAGSARSGARARK